MSTQPQLQTAALEIRTCTALLAMAQIARNVLKGTSNWAHAQHQLLLLSTVLNTQALRCATDAIRGSILLEPAAWPIQPLVISSYKDAGHISKA